MPFLQLFPGLSGLAARRLQDDDVLGGFKQNFRPFIRDQERIFNPAADFAWDVDARLNGKRHTPLQMPLVALLHVRGFMDHIANAMAKTGGKIFPLPGLVDDIAGRFVHVWDIGAFHSGHFTC